MMTEERSDIPTKRKVTLRVIGALGAILFATFFSFTYTVPTWVESFAADFIERKATEKLDQRIDSLGPPAGENAVARLAQKMYENNEERIEKLRSALKAKAHEEIAGAIAKVRDLDCECRERWAQAYKDGFEFRLDFLQTANDKLTDFVQSTYMSVLGKLKRDIRIFTGTNALAFLTLLIMSFAKPQAIRHLFLPGVLLLVATVICSYFYVFEQNWLLTIIYSNYVGFLYMGYLGVVFLLLSDIAFNYGRVTTEIINGFLSLIGMAASAVTPC